MPHVDDLNDPVLASLTAPENLDVLDELHWAVFGSKPGDEPDIYADHDRLVDLMRRSRKALDSLRLALPH